MTQEEKAKAYDEAIERARYWAKCPTVWNSDDICQKIFPELVESEENRIKRCIGMALTDVSERRFTDYDTSLRDCLAWLEKQGEQKVPVNDFKAKDWYYSKVDGKRHNIFHSIDNIEPKFKVGDWIVNDNSGGVCQVTEIRDNEYCLWPLDAEIKGYLRIIDVDNDYHLWSIQDAKEGDILAFDTIVLIVDHLGTFENRPIIYSWYFANSEKFHGIGPSEPDRWEVKGFQPATHEQRDLLFQKMKDAGYEWDEAKKELKKIAIHKWENGDIVRLKKDDGTRWQIAKSNDPDFFDEWFISQIRESGIAGGYVSTYILDTDYEFVNNPINDAQKEIDKEFDKLRKTTSETAWNKNDDNLLSWTNDNLKKLKDRYGKDYGNVGKCIEWLKSIKERLGGKELKGE